MIQGHGSTTPSIIFLADSPHGNDLTSNYALTGYQGKLIAQWCREAGIHPDDTWKTCLIKEEFKLTDHQQGRKTNWNKVHSLIGKYSSVLEDEVKNLNPYIIVPLGELGFNYLTDLNGIEKFRGSILTTGKFLSPETKPYKVLPILGPYPYLYKNPRMEFITKSVDFKKLPQYLHRNPPPENTNNLWICRDPGNLRIFLNRQYPSAKMLVFDIETWLGIPTCLSFCFDGYESVCVPILDSSISIDNRALMLDLVSKVLASDIPKVNQNIKYDWKKLESWGFKVNNVVGDTAAAASILYCEFPKNLGFLTSIYTEIPYFKDEGKEYDPTKHSRDRYYLYNAKDSLATYQIYQKQLEELEELGVKKVYEKVIQLMPLYKRMEECGVRVDDARRKDLILKYETLYRLEMIRLRTLTNNPDFNPASPKQCDELIFDILKFKKSRGVQGSDEESLELLMAGPPDKYGGTGKTILQHIINTRKIKKVLEILDLAVYPDGRFRCEFNTGGTETGRSSAGKTTDEYMVLTDEGKIKRGTRGRLPQYGHSLQTIGKHGFFIEGVQYGKDVRSMYVPSRGYRFVEVDLSQAEARVDAVLSGNYKILEVFDGPVGIHRLTGSWIMDCKPEEIKKGTIEYHLAKTVRHAGERNMKAGRLMAMTQEPIEKCEAVLTKFHHFQPEIREVFHKEIREALETRRSLIMPNGRRRDFFGRIDESAINEGISTIPQAVVADQTRFSLIPTFEECNWARLLAEQHDGTLAEVPIGREEEYINVYKKNIEIPIDFRNCTLSRNFELLIPCEASIGDNWEVMK